MLLPMDLLENLEESHSSYPCRAIAALLASLDAQDKVLMRLVSTFGRCDDCISSFPRHSQVSVASRAADSREGPMSPSPFGTWPTSGLVSCDPAASAQMDVSLEAYCPASVNKEYIASSCCLLKTTRKFLSYFMYLFN